MSETAGTEGSASVSEADTKGRASSGITFDNICQHTMPQLLHPDASDVSFATSGCICGPVRMHTFSVMTSPAHAQTRAHIHIPFPVTTSDRYIGFWISLSRGFYSLDFFLTM